MSDKFLTGHVSIHDNPVDIYRKIIPGCQKHDQLIGLILYNLGVLWVTLFTRDGD